MRQDAIARILRSLAHRRSTAIVGSRGSGRSRLLHAIATRLAADGVPAVLFSADAPSEAGAVASTSGIPMTPLAREAGRLGLPGIARSQRLAAALAAQGAPLVVLVDESGRLTDDDRRALPPLSAHPQIALVTSWSPRDWSALVDTPLDPERRDDPTGVIEAELVPVPPLDPVEIARLVTAHGPGRPTDPLTIGTLRHVAGGHAGLTTAVLESGHPVLGTALETFGATPGVRRAVAHWLAECSDDQRALLALLAEIPTLRRTDALHACGAAEIAALVAEGIVIDSPEKDALRASSSLVASVTLSARSPAQRSRGRRLLVDRVVGRWHRTRRLSLCEETFISDLWLDEGGECVLASCPRSLIDEALTACAVHANDSAEPEKAAQYARAAVEFGASVTARLELAKTRIMMGDPSGLTGLTDELLAAPDDLLAPYLEFALWLESTLVDPRSTAALGDLLARAARNDDPAIRSRARATIMAHSLSSTPAQEAAAAVRDAVMTGELREPDEAGLLCLMAMRLVHAGRPADAVAAVSRASSLSRSLATSPRESAHLRTALLLTSTMTRVSAGDPLAGISSDLDRKIGIAIAAGDAVIARMLTFLSSVVDVERGRSRRAAETLTLLRDTARNDRTPTVLQDAIRWHTVRVLLVLGLVEDAETAMAETGGRVYPSDLVADHLRMIAEAGLVRQRQGVDALTDYMEAAISAVAPRSRHLGAELVAVAIGLGAEPRRIDAVAVDLHDLQGRRSEAHMRLLHAIRQDDAVALRAAVDRYREIGMESSATHVERFLLGQTASRPLAPPESAPRPSAPAAPLPTLTRREREIAGLIGDGLTNRQIAARLNLSPRTVESHVLQARGKIGASTRSALAAAMLHEPGPEHERRYG